MRFIEQAWYKPNWKSVFWYIIALPLSLLFGLISYTRKGLYRTHILKTKTFSKPVIVVGNINVGGTGKTPFVIRLVSLLKSWGYKPGIVSRGYGALEDSQHPYPRLIDDNLPVSLSGDEPKLLAMRTGCPVVIAPKRIEAIDYLLAHSDVDIVISDDGLQHYAMARHAEIVLLDGLRGLGNGCLLPLGPLREPARRLQSVDLTIVNQGSCLESEYQSNKCQSNELQSDEHQSHKSISRQLTKSSSFDQGYYLVSGDIYALENPNKTLSIESIDSVHLVSGIGNPARFQKSVEALGLNLLSTKWYPDHHNFALDNFNEYQALEQGEIILITEKDAVKCKSLGVKNCYVLPISAKLSDTLVSKLKQLVVSIH